MPYQKNRDFYALLDQVEFSLKKRLPFSIYRKPTETLVNGVFQSNDALNYAVTFKEKGFVFAPFDLKNDTVLISPDKTTTASFVPADFINAKGSTAPDLGKNYHIKLVEKAIKAIKAGTLKKVVLSRKIDIALSKKPLKIFQSLLENYPNAFCYLFFHPKLGMWCGATPETLVHINGTQLRTMSLAATLTIKDSVRPEWGSKEVEEQKMVTNYIKQRLNPSLEEMYVGEPESVKAGKLWHLKSEIKGKIAPKTTIKEIIAALHPTPAVCGIPTQSAKVFIQENENYQRTFYTGFLGELNLTKEKQAALFVNLRCMELNNGKASIFVGGGITEASNPESEWSETQNKSKTMLGIT